MTIHTNLTKKVILVMKKKLKTLQQTNQKKLRDIWKVITIQTQMKGNQIMIKAIVNIDPQVRKHHINLILKKSRMIN